MARLAQRNAFENGCVAFMVGSFVGSFVGVCGLFCGLFGERFIDIDGTVYRL